MKNNNLKPVLQKHFRKKTKKIKFKTDVDNINVKLISAPTYEELSKYIPQFVSATWCDKPGQGKVFKKLKSNLMDLFFDNKLLPTAMETVNLVFEVTGIEHTTASHLIRHRMLSFSARTHADRDNRDDVYTIPGSIKDSKYREEYEKICQDAVNLYGKMLDSNEISTMDARAILPRSEETYYFVRGNLKDIMSFIKTRIDVQTQPQTDNILSMLMWKEILKLYPMLHDKIDFEQKDMFYINAARTDVGHNLFAPAEKNDVFEWNEKDFIYNKHRDEFIGAQYYLKRKRKIVNEINNIVKKWKKSNKR
jgi:thymidylate synthase ThyX